jgi:hypothetical protein
MEFYIWLLMYIFMELCKHLFWDSLYIQKSTLTELWHMKTDWHKNTTICYYLDYCFQTCTFIQ